MNAINPREQAAADAECNGINFPVLACRETSVVRDYEVTKLPQLFIIDGNGVIRESTLFLKAEQIQETIENLLADPEKASLNR